MDDLGHFRAAQDRVLAAVEAELAAGRKTSHWMWYVFPQRAGLGLSEMSRRYAIRDLDHARRYLGDPVLGGRLRTHVRMVRAALDHASAEAIFGPVDAAKLRSSLALFLDAAAADGDEPTRSLFAETLAVIGRPERY